MSGILRITIGLIVLGAGLGTYLKLAKRYEQAGATIVLGSTGIEVSWPLFLFFVGAAGLLGVTMILLGVLSLRDRT